MASRQININQGDRWRYLIFNFRRLMGADTSSLYAKYSSTYVGAIVV